MFAKSISYSGLAFAMVTPISQTSHMSQNDTVNIDIAHEPDVRSFIAKGGGTLEYEIDAAGNFVITHVVVPEQLRGRGIAAHLVQRALRYAESNQLGVVAQCEYADQYLKKHHRA